MGLTTPWSSRGGCFADFDNDGRRGTLPSTIWMLAFRSSATKAATTQDVGFGSAWKADGNRSAIGTRVIVEANSRQMQEIRSGSGYQSSHDLRLHFRSGIRPEKLENLTIRWTNGEEQSFQGRRPQIKGYSLRQGGRPGSKRSSSPQRSDHLTLSWATENGGKRGRPQI